jgi:hypothetical protein
VNSDNEWKEALSIVGEERRECLVMHLQALAVRLTNSAINLIDVALHMIRLMCHRRMRNRE